MNRKVLTCICLAMLWVAPPAGLHAWRWYYDRKVSNFKALAELYVYPGMGPEAVADTLAGKGVVKNAGSLRRAFRKEKGIVRPGHYTIGPECSSMYAARMISRGWQTPVNLVLAGSLRTRGGIASKVAAQMMMDSVQVASAMADSALLAGFGATPETVFTLFMPDTYQMYWTDGMDKVFAKQKEAVDAYWSESNLAKAEKLGLSRLQVTTLASIVKGETNFVPEMPSVAGVYLNRLRKGMKLQADPTVAWCFDYKLNRILNVHLKYDSPYNTYLHAGLPPAPICVPPREALDAVLNPDTHSYLYFCASPDFNGTHRFAKTYPEHLANARAFQKALNNRK